MQTLKVGAANQVDDTQTGRHCPADVDAPQISFRNVSGLARIEIQTAQANPQPAHGQRDQRAFWSFRQFQSNRLEHDSIDRQPFLDMPAHQQLRTRALPQFQRAPSRSCFGRL